jgi:hypothetical protein
MSGEVVGTAFIKIKALTRGLAKDIEKSVKKGMADAKLDKAGEEEGKKLGKSMGDSTVDSASETIKKRSGDIVPKDAFEDVRKKFNKEGGLLGDFDILPEGTEEKISESFDRINKSISEGFSEGAGSLSDTEILSDADAAKIQKDFERQANKVRSNLYRINKNMVKEFPKDGSSIGDSTLVSDDDVAKINKQHQRQFDKVRSNLYRINQSMAKAFPQVKAGDIVPDLTGEREDTERDTNAIGGALDRLFNKMKSLGDSGGGGLPGGFLGKSVAGIGGAIVAALPYIQDVGSAVLSYATGLVAQVGFLTTALAGFGAAAGAAIGGALLPLGPIMLAFKAETEELTIFKDSLKAAGEEFLRIGIATQATLLPALDDAIFQMGELVPMFSEFGFFVGQAVGNFARLASLVLTGEMAQGRFAAILQSSMRILDMLMPMILDVGNILSGIWVAAAPAAERFVGTLSRMVHRWSEIVNFGLYTGTLTDTLNTWYDRAELVGRALGNLAGAVFDILSVGADSADSVFVRFDEWAKRYRAWTESEVGQNKLKLIFDNSLAVMREINGVVSDLFDGIFGRLGDVGGVDSMVEALQNFRDVLPEIKEEFQGFVDQIRDVNSIVGPQLVAKFTQAFEELKEPIGRLVYAILDVMSAMEESGAFETFLDLMKILAEVLTTLLSIPGFGTFIGYMIAFGGAAKVARFAIGPLVSVMGPFVSIIQALVKAKAATTLIGTAKGLTAVSAASKVAINANLAAGFSNIITGAGGAAGAIGGLGGAAKGLPAATKTATGAGGRLAGALGKIGPALLPLGPWGIAAGVGIAAAGTAFYFATKDGRAFKQEVRQLEGALGKLNGGLNITTQGLRDYLAEDSRFVSRNQKDDLERMGFSFKTLGKEIANGTISYTEFAEAAIKAGEVSTQIGIPTGRGQGRDVELVTTSLKDLQREYNLTEVQVNRLARGESIRAKGTRLQLKGNTDVIDSFTETRKALGQAAKDNIKAFESNAQNIRLLGRGAVSAIAKDIEQAGKLEAGEIMIETLDRLGRAADNDSRKVKGLSSVIRDQIDAQVAHLGANDRAIEKNRLLRAEQEKLFARIRESIKLVSSADFRKTSAFESMQSFSDLTKGLDFRKFSDLANNGDVDTLLQKFPGLADATKVMFDNLKDLPAEEFNAAAASMNLDADSLRAAMEGAAAAITHLQDTAVSKLPTISQLLDEATGVTEDGDQFFREDKFLAGVDERIRNTNQFATDIKTIKEKSGDEAARMAAQEGPVAARNLAEMAVGGDGEGLRVAIDRMKAAEEGLRKQISDVLGPAIALQYMGQAKPMSEAWGFGLAAGLNSEGTLSALRGSSLDTLNYLARGFKGHFVLDIFGLRFIHTGTFNSWARHRPRWSTGGGGGVPLSSGGFVGMEAFGNGPQGTDTVPAWLTPGEFVLRRKIAQAIPRHILHSLNAGDTRLMGLLTSLGRNRPGSPNITNAITATPVSTSRTGVVIEQMNIVAPSPLDASRLMVDRLRILQAQSTGV